MISIDPWERRGKILRVWLAESADEDGYFDSSCGTITYACSGWLEQWQPKQARRVMINLAHVQSIDFEIDPEELEGLSAIEALQKED